jgi:predicted nucleic acid-binding protein
VAALVDTSAWIEFFKPRGLDTVRQTVGDALEEGLVITTVPVLAELLVGLQPTRATDAKAIQLLQGLTVVDLTWMVCDQAGALGRATARRGQRVPTVDLLIAAAAMSGGHEVWHVGDQHFALLGQVSRLRQINLAHP